MQTSPMIWREQAMRRPQQIMVGKSTARYAHQDCIGRRADTQHLPHTGTFIFTIPWLPLPTIRASSFAVHGVHW